MGHLFIINDSLELEFVPVANRNTVFLNFCIAVDAARKVNDSFYATSDIYTRDYSYGTFIYDFLFARWDEIKNNQNLIGISSTTINLYHSLAMAIPGFIQVVQSHQEFEKQYSALHSGFSGFEMHHPPDPFIYSYLSWQTWKQIWYRNNQNQIPWQANGDRFLPNLKESEKILLDEIKNHGKESELNVVHRGNIGLAFHEEIMRHKGHDTEAYTISIGKKILMANYFKYEDELSRDEQRLARSLRNIYSIISRNGDIQYVSLDHRHGMFEYHSEDGTHLGEFKFDGSFNSKAEVSHNLRTI